MPKIIKLEYMGMTKDLVGWATWLGIPYETFHKRYLKYKVHGENAKLFKKYKARNEGVDGDGEKIKEADVLIECRGVKKSIGVWCEELRLPCKAVIMRYRRGVRGEALLAPVRMYTYRTVGW